MEVARPAVVTTWLEVLVRELRKRRVIGVAAAVVAVGLGIVLRRRKQAKPQSQPPTRQLDKQEFRRFKLLERHVLSPSVRLFVFEVPGATLNLPTGKHVQLAFTRPDGHQASQIIRSHRHSECSATSASEERLAGRCCAATPRRRRPCLDGSTS